MAKKRSLVKQFLDENTYNRELIQWSKVHTMPGLKGGSIFRVFGELLVHLKKAKVPMRSSAISFNFMLASFPFMIFLLTLLPYFQIENAVDLLKSSIGGLLPVSVESALFSLIKDTIKPRGGLLSLGFILALLFASNGIMSLMRAFDQSEIATLKEIHWAKKRLKAMFLTFLMFMLLVVTVITIVLANQILKIVGLYVTIDYVTKVIILVARWIPVFILMYGLLTLIYRLAPSIKVKIPYIAFGTFVTTFLCIIDSLLISYFVNNFADYNKIYGSIGAILAIMIWLQTNMFLIFIGYELNLIVMRLPRSKKVASA